MTPMLVPDRDLLGDRQEEGTGNVAEYMHRHRPEEAHVSRMWQGGMRSHIEACASQIQATPLALAFRGG